MGGAYGSILAFFFGLGGFGLFLIAIADSSFLLLPVANDLLVVLLTSKNPSLLFYYAAMTTAGSVIGFFLLDLVFRKGSQATLEKHVSSKRMDYLKGKIEKNGGMALAIGALIPPPFPMKPLAATASALQYPRKKYLTIIGGARFVRFLLDGIVAIFLGEQVLAVLNSPIVQDLVYALIVIAVLGSAGSVYLWVKRSKGQANHGPRPD
ncbi:MAG: hypothetical protein M1541_04515 [Acidobacteria bacterium]|nr:hypothetical protein [Acidobacteriota bacterium]